MPLLVFHSWLYATHCGQEEDLRWMQYSLSRVHVSGNGLHSVVNGPFDSSISSAMSSSEKLAQSNLAHATNYGFR